MNAIQARKLEGTLNHLRKGLEQCLTMLSEADLIWPAPFRAQRILDAVSEAFGVPIQQFCHKDSRAHVCAARQTAQYLLREYLDLSYPEIARITGLRDHTTVLYSVRKITKMRRASAEFNKRLEKIEDKLEAKQ